MWLENKIFHEDLEYITNQEFIQWRRLQNKTVFYYRRNRTYWIYV